MKFYVRINKKEVIRKCNSALKTAFLSSNSLFYRVWIFYIVEIVLKPGLSLKKTPHVWLLHAKTTFNCYGVDSKSHKIWGVISMKLSISKKITGLETLTLNCKIYHVSKLIELMFKACVRYFPKIHYTSDLKT